MPDATIPVPAYIASDEVNGRLAYDLATGLHSVEQVMLHYGLNGQQMEALLENPHFLAMVKEARAKFNSGLSTPERIQAKAQIALEGCIAPMFSIVHDPQAQKGLKIDATKVLSSIAGLAKGDAVPQQAQKFILNINLGDRQVGVTAEPKPVVIDQ